MKTDDKKIVKWYDNAGIISTLIIVVILMMLISSQSFAVVGNNSFRIFSSVINYNTSYLLILIYFVAIKTHFGKRLFNYFNVFLIFIYLLLSITSFLTIIQSFSFNTIFIFLENIVLLIYLFHTMFRDTKIWKEFKLGDSPFNEISNDYYFATVLTLVTFNLIINLISTVVISGLVVSIFDAIYVVLLSRYIYLYREYLDENRLDINNKGNFDSIKESLNQDINEIKQSINDVTDNIKDKTSEFIEKHDIDDKIDGVKDKIKETGDSIKNKTDEFIEKHDIDDKIDGVKDKIKETTDIVKDKANDFIEKNIDKETKNTKVKDKKKSTKKTSTIKKKGDK